MPSSPLRRPILVGESNPYGSDPNFALYPAPDGCSGHRLCCLILGMRRTDYLREFDRINLCEGDWDRTEAEDRMLDLCNRRERIILLGAKVAGVLCLDFRPFTATRLEDIGTILMLPHPSGRNRLWSDPANYLRARQAVAALAPELTHLLGVAE